MQILGDRSGYRFWSSLWALIRRSFIRLWRMIWRIERATIARTGLVARSTDGQYLLLNSSGYHLPSIELNGRVNITHQTKAVAQELLGTSVDISLVAIEGTCGDVSFLFRTDPDSTHHRP